jgi:uncharacterized protein (DUF1499 family)
MDAGTIPSRVTERCETRRSGRVARTVALTCALATCTGIRPEDRGAHGSSLLPCPASPNCVSSEAQDSHRVPGFTLTKSSDPAWAAVAQTLAALPRTKIITQTADYLHAECTSAIFRFVDDLELQLRSDGTIAVRSASRLGYGDMGVNRRRVERLRALLIERGVAR